MICSSCRRSDRAAAAQALSKVRQISLVMMSAAMDREMVGDNDTGWPVDAGLGSVAEVRQMLVSNGYLSDKDAASLGFENFLIGNVSKDDPENTILLKSKPGTGEPSIVILMSGAGGVMQPGQTEEGEIPPRDPPFLQ